MPPTIASGDATKAGPWLDHVRRIYPNDADHIIMWLAYRVRHPEVKINHALVLGGAPGIGKDTLLEPIKHAIGPWNFAEATPTQIMGRFNGFIKSVILRVNEVRDLGDVDRYSFFEHIKNLIAAPPDVLRCDEKNLREYPIINATGIIYTTNYKTDGVYLPADDRRHFAAWSEAEKENFADGYWGQLWGWYESGGDSHVAAYLRQLDISYFDPKAPPPLTPAFWAIVDANRPHGESELADALDALGNPNAVTIAQIKMKAPFDLGRWLEEPKNRRNVPRRMQACGYAPIHNPYSNEGLWRVNENGQTRRQMIYAKKNLPPSDQLKAAKALAIPEI